LSLTAGNSEIGMQADLNGTYVNRWFENNHNLFSRPLSRVRPKATPVDLTAYDDNGNLLPGIPVFALFTFSAAANTIDRLALYLDRFKFVQRLGEEDTTISIPGALATQGTSRAATRLEVMHGTARSPVTIRIDVD